MIKVKNLTKYFGTIKAVNNLSFVVKKGEILGFLGPNGAGKSTTMRMITGFLPPSSGSAVVGGHDIIEDSISAREKIGYLPENAPVYPDMSVISYLNFCAEIRGFSGSSKRKKVEETIDKCFLSEVKYQIINTLSKGFRQRVCFAQSIIHNPEYLIFDEPTDGLDPNQKHEVRLMIRDMSEEKAIILSTHILDEVENVCTRAIIISNGAIAVDDTPDNLKAKSPVHGAVSLTLADTDTKELSSFLLKLSGVKSIKVLENKDDNETAVLVYPENTKISLAERIMPPLLENNYKVKSIFVQQGRLDEVFRSITGDSA